MQTPANMKHPVPNKQAKLFLKWIPPAVIFNMPYAVKRMMDSPNIPLILAVKRMALIIIIL